MVDSWQEFVFRDEDILSFNENGFVKLKGFLTEDVVDMLLVRTETEMGSAPDNFKSEFSRLKYDFETEKEPIYDLVQSYYFQQTLTTITGRNLFLTFELCFELQAGVSKGFPWHVGVQSFGYQRGGMAYVPDKIISGRLIYDQIEPAIISTLESKECTGTKTSMEDYFGLRAGILNSPTMDDILEAHCTEDDFDPGDILLFNKYVVHRSINLEEGELDRRAAFVMRFVEASSHYDRQRAENLEYPTIKYGHKQFTHSHIEIDLPDGGILSDSPYFDNKSKRMIKKTGG